MPLTELEGKMLRAMSRTSLVIRRKSALKEVHELQALLREIDVILTEMDRVHRDV